MCDPPFSLEKKQLAFSPSLFAISLGLLHRTVNDDVDDNGDTFHDCYDCC